MNVTHNTGRNETRLTDVSPAELSKIDGGMIQQIGGLFDRATIFHPADVVTIYVDGMYYGMGTRV